MGLYEKLKVCIIVKVVENRYGEAFRFGGMAREFSQIASSRMARFATTS